MRAPAARRLPLAALCCVALLPLLILMIAAPESVLARPHWMKNALQPEGAAAAASHSSSTFEDPLEEHLAMLLAEMDSQAAADMSSNPDFMLTGNPTIDAVISAAQNSACAQFQFTNSVTPGRPVVGKARPPLSFMRGMALAYAKQICQPNKEDTVLASRTTTDSKDIFSVYNKVPMTSPQVVLRNLYALLVGFAMSESGGYYCVGPQINDTPGAAPVYASADLAEAGLFQAHYRAATIDKKVQALYAAYRSKYRGQQIKSEGGYSFGAVSEVSTAPGCMGDYFADRISCTDSNAINVGDALQTADSLAMGFQQLTKTCPLFAVEYAAAALRINGGRSGTWSSASSGKAELRPECVAMFAEVEKLVPGPNAPICKQI